MTSIPVLTVLLTLVVLLVAPSEAVEREGLPLLFMVCSVAADCSLSSGLMKVRLVFIGFEKTKLSSE